MASLEKQLSSKTLYQGRVIKLRVDEAVVVEKNVETVREVIEHPGGCACLVKTKDNKIIFVKQFRYPYQEFSLELPAGKRDNNEEPLVTISRELEEEAGIKPIKIEKVLEVWPSPGILNEVLHLYYTDDYVLSKKDLDEDESLDRIYLTYDEAMDLLNEGKIKDAKTIILLLRCKDKFK